jgi:hypothetical protein
MIAPSQMSGHEQNQYLRECRQQSTRGISRRTEPGKIDSTGFSDCSPRTSETNYENLTRCLRTDLPGRCRGGFACFKKAINQINKRIGNLNKVLSQSNISQNDRNRYKGIKDRLNFRLLVISRFIDLFPNATDIKLFGWGTANKVTPDNTKAPSELSGVQCKINGKEVYLNFNSTIGNFEELSKESEWQTSFETKNAEWYFSSTNPYFNSRLAKLTKEIELPSQQETVEAKIWGFSPEKPRRQPPLPFRPTLPPEYRNVETILTEDKEWGIVSAYLDLYRHETQLSPRNSDAWGLSLDKNKGDLSGRSGHLSDNGEGVDRSLSPYSAFATPP